MIKAYFLQTFAWICWIIFVSNGMFLEDCTIPNSVCVFMFIMGVTSTIYSLAILAEEIEDSESAKCDEGDQKESEKCDEDN